MTDEAFDLALVSSAMGLAGENGWSNLNVPAAARMAGLSLAKAKERFGSRLDVLRHLGQMLDQACLADCPSEGPVRDRLFDLLMRRFDGLQVHRAGVLSLLTALPYDPPAAAMLAFSTRRSMRWILEATGVNTSGLRGKLQEQGLMVVWLWGVRAWQRDGSADLSTTMAAVDSALKRAEATAGWLEAQSDRLPTNLRRLGCGRTGSPGQPETDEDLLPAAPPETAP